MDWQGPMGLISLNGLEGPGTASWALMGKRHIWARGSPLPGDNLDQI